MTNQRSPDLDLFLLYMNAAKKVCLPVTTESRITTAKKFRQTGDIEARNALVESGLLWVVKIARTYAHRYNANCYLQDLIQEGNVGLIQAAEKFNPELGYSFTTYATYHIRKCIIYYLVDKHPTVSIPNNKVFELAKLNRTKEVLEKKLKREPTNQEIKDFAFPDHSENKFNFLLEINIKRYSVSIDTPAQENEDRPVKVFPELVTHSKILAQLESENLQEKIVECFTQTIKSPRDLKIVLAFFGFAKDREGPVGLVQLGEEFGVTYQAIEQIIKKSIKNRFFVRKIKDLLKEG